ncbi:LacI family DNA-binding transcriptional regulator [Mucilaginibacter sabulilitoris]|uniref:LacI family DNA-binding transcriptional regulator n=1 Tax=Mucilaginibacter sabulilitoris TaxID=1173583 RepID=A0ABZ0TYY2_9SPHI|nr:LacI family DNA-binding transcriptional regulator [Mucilaginibacter sabulilitoris]WPU97024.1 LacI family DNA-binding transcriptional regulator [Mucilaginibacter sabulilitoris]
MSKKLSINDIANELHVAKSTVSFILNGKAKEKRISEELTERVLKFVEEKGYRPNQLAKSLSTGKTKMICLLVEKISDYFFSHIAFHLEALAYKNGYKIIYCSTENDPEKTRELISLLRARHVDGYIITPPPGIETEIQALLTDGLPVVLFDRYLPGIPTDYVGLDNYHGTYEAVEFLVKALSKRIALVTLNSGQTQMLERRDGYMTALKKYKLKPLILKVPFENPMETTVKQSLQFIKDNPDIDAIIFATNYLALSGIKAINEAGLQIPSDIGVIAFDDHDVFRIYNPSISAIAQPLDEMAKQLFKILLDKLENRVRLKDLSKIIIQPELILRGSTTDTLVRK